MVAPDLPNQTSDQQHGFVLALEDLHKRYGDVVALDGASLHAQRGRILGFLGPNGVGKTTAMRSVFGLVALDKGTASWDGKRITPSDRLRFGYLPEQLLAAGGRVKVRDAWRGAAELTPSR